MNYCFIERTQEPHRFFNILPEDWQESIVPFWADYEQTTRIFTLETPDEIVGGGMVFYTPPPDFRPEFNQEAQKWYSEGFLYIGFLWIKEKHRDKQLGTSWLKSVFTLLPEHTFWLAIDEYRLTSFYQRNGFELIRKVEMEDYPEWVMALPPKHDIQASPSLLNK